MPMHFHQFEDLKFQFFSGKHVRDPPSKSLVSAALACPIVPTLITWFCFVRYAPSVEKSCIPF